MGFHSLCNPTWAPTRSDFASTNEKLNKVMESERNMSASMASLRAEVTNACVEIEGEAGLAEKEEQIEMEMT
jgi:hypothetical protein